MSRARAALARAAALLVFASCSATPAAPTSTVTSAPVATGALHGALAPAPLAARLPSPAPPLAPAQVTLAGAVDGALLTETESCAGCHADAAAQWRSSAHASASFNNPIYRVVVDRFRAEVGRDASRFCAGCHDVALLVDGAMSGEVAPADGRAHGGVTCRVCHGIEEARPDGNGSFTLAASPVPIPRDGDAASLAAHRARVALAPLRTAALCGSCHRSFLSPATGNPAHLVGQDDLGEWRRSVYAGSRAARVDEAVEPAGCRTCHMPRVEAPLGDAAARGGTIASHRFAGGNSWLAAMRGDAGQLAAVTAMVRGAAQVRFAAAVSDGGERTLPADGAPVTPGRGLALDVVVHNARAGHRFPGGVLDAQDTWLELEVRDALGRLRAEAGTRQEATGDDPTAHVLRAVQADARGEPLLLRETQRFRAPVYNHTIAPRDAEVVRFRLEVPAGLGPRELPLRAVVRLRHRSRDLALARQVCADARTPRGAAFARQVLARTDAALRPCAPEPVIDVDEAAVTLGGPAGDATPSASAWRTLLLHGRALLHGQQEELDAARPSLERALALAPLDAPSRGEVLFALAELAVRQGRTGEALARLDEAGAAGMDEPALDAERGAALAGVWRWADAAGPLARAAEGAPLDDGAWTRLAVALGSAGDPRGQLDAAGRGLELTPRSADLLRTQALALEALGATAAQVAEARDAFSEWRPPDDAPAIKNACAKRHPGCALERLPVHTHDLRAFAYKPIGSNAQ